MHAKNSISTSLPVLLKLMVVSLKGLQNFIESYKTSTFDLGAHQFLPGGKQKITKKRKLTVSWFTFVRLRPMSPA